MKFIDINDLAESIAEYVDDAQLGDDEIILSNNSKTQIQFKSWLRDVETTNSKIEYTKDYIKLSLS